MTQRAQPIAAVLSALLVLVLAGRGVNAQAADDNDIENAATPTALVDLLPEGGIDAVDIDFWLLMEVPADTGGDAYMHWSIHPEDGKLVFEMSQGGAAGGFHNTTRLVYSAEGAIQSYYSDMGTDEFGSTTTGEVVGDELVLSELTRSNNPGGKPTPNVRRVPLKELEGKIPFHWLPLVFAYHIREGNLGYTVTMQDIERGADNGTMRVEDMGTETIEFEGEKLESHLLKMAITEEGTAGEQAGTMVVLENGEFMRMTHQEVTFELHAKRITEQEAQEKFGLKPEDATAE